MGGISLPEAKLTKNWGKANLMFIKEVNSGIRWHGLSGAGFSLRLFVLARTKTAQAEARATV
jgi:hypothetical protein